MKTLEVGVPPFNSTLVGMVRGVANAFGNPVSDPMLYGGSGHAFVIHIHETLCPSGPYCWNRSPFMTLLQNLGITMTDLGFFSCASTPEQRAEVESLLIAEVDADRPAGLVNMEFQLITGYDDTGFLTSQPWPGHDFPPRHLTFGSWEEIGAEIHINYFSFEPCKPVEPIEAIRRSLEFAVGLHDHPSQHAGAHYGMGPDAYRLWKAAIPEHGASHGNWWNATVWAECRRQASEYFREIAALTGLPVASQLAEGYADISSALCGASEREISTEAKLERVTYAEAVELEAIENVRKLLAVL